MLSLCNFHLTILLNLAITVTTSLSPSFLDISESSLHFCFFFSTTPFPSVNFLLFFVFADGFTAHVMVLWMKRSLIGLQIMDTTVCIVGQKPNKHLLVSAVCLVELHLLHILSSPSYLLLELALCTVSKSSTSTLCKTFYNIPLSLKTWHPDVSCGRASKLLTRKSYIQACSNKHNDFVSAEFCHCKSLFVYTRSSRKSHYFSEILNLKMILV